MKQYRRDYEELRRGLKAAARAKESPQQAVSGKRQKQQASCGQYVF